VAAADSGASAPLRLGFERVRGWPADRWRWSAQDVRAELWLSPLEALRPGLLGSGVTSHPLAALAAAVPARMGELPAAGAVVRMLMLFQDPDRGPTALLLELDAVEPGRVDPALFTVPADFTWIEPPPARRQ
jgi:hypothetical protein